MRTPRSFLLAGAAAGAIAISIAAGAGFALAKDSSVHNLTVRFPDGAIAQIQYAGHVPPRVSFDSDPFSVGLYGPTPLAVSPFADFNRISAQMDADMDTLMRQGDALAFPIAAPPENLYRVGQILPGTTRYAFAAMAGGDGAYCMRSMEVTSKGAGERPKIVSHSYGDCRAIGQATYGTLPAVRQRRTPHSTIEAKTGPHESFDTSRLVEAAYNPTSR